MCDNVVFSYVKTKSAEWPELMNVNVKSYSLQQNVYPDKNMSNIVFATEKLY